MSYFAQQFVCASPRDPSIISFSSFPHKSPLAACIDFCCTCSLELCVITFMTLIIANLFCKVEIPFIIYVFGYQSIHMFLLGSVLIRTLPLMTFLPCPRRWKNCVAMDFCESLKTLTDWWLQEKIQLQLNSREDWIQLLNSGWAGLDILGRAHKHQSAFRLCSGMLFPVFEALILLRQNVLRNEPLRLYLCKINKKNVLWNQIC